MQKGPVSFPGFKGTVSDLIITRVFYTTMQVIASFWFFLTWFRAAVKISVGFSPCTMLINFFMAEKQNKTKKSENYLRWRTPARKKIEWVKSLLLHHPATCLENFKLKCLQRSYRVVYFFIDRVHREKEKTLCHIVGTNTVHSTKLLPCKEPIVLPHFLTVWGKLDNISQQLNITFLM